MRKPQRKPTPSPLSMAGPVTVRSGLATVPSIARILPQYVAGLARDVGLIVAHHAAGHRPELRRLAHQLRGSGGAYGFPEVTRLAAGVESAIDTGQPPDSVAAGVENLVSLIRAIDGYDAAGEAAPIAE